MYFNFHLARYCILHLIVHKCPGNFITWQKILNDYLAVWLVNSTISTNTDTRIKGKIEQWRLIKGKFIDLMCFKFRPWGRS